MFWVSKKKYSDLSEKYNDLEKKITRLEEEKQTLNSEITSLREKNKTLTSDAKVLDKKITKQERKISLKDFEKIRGLILKEAEELREFYNNKNIDYELVRRLLTYRECFKKFSLFEVVGSPKLGETAGLKPSTIKSDMNFLNIEAMRGKGYLVDDILEGVKRFLEKKNSILRVEEKVETKKALTNEENKGKEDNSSKEILKELEDILI